MDDRSLARDLSVRTPRRGARAGRRQAALEEGPSWRKGARVRAALAAVLWATACGDDATGPGPVPNRAPTVLGPIPAQTVTVGETATVDAAAHFSDPDGDVLFYVASSSNAGVASVATVGDAGAVSVTGVAKGAASATVAARDAYGLSATLSFSVVVPNQAPVATDSVSDRTVFVGEAISVDLASKFSDPDGDALSYAASSSDTAVASVSVSGYAATVTGVRQGQATLTVTATDADGLSAQLSFAVVVPNQAPVAAGAVPAQSVFVGEATTVDLASRFSDPDGDDLTYAASSSNARVASVSVAGDAATLTGVRQGRATLTVTATDAGGLSAELSFAVTVPNRAPVAKTPIQERSVFVGEAFSIDLASHLSDPDGDPLSFAASSSNVRVATVSVAGDAATVTGVRQGRATLTVTATDGNGLSAKLAFAVTVPNRAPVVGGAVPAQSVFVDESISVDVAPSFSDPDGDPLAYAASSSNARVVAASVVGDAATLTGVARGQAIVTVAASDPAGLFATLSFAVTVPNRAPVATGAVPAQSVVAGASVPVDLASRFSDPDGDALSYAASSSDATVASVSVAGDTATATGVRQGRATLTVTATDGGGLSAELSFAVAVTASATHNDPPVATGFVPVQFVAQGGRVRIEAAALFRDPNGDALAYSATSSNPAAATVAIEGSTAWISGRSSGVTSVRITATDPGGLSAHVDFAVTVEGVAGPNQRPVATAAISELFVATGGTIPLDLASHFSDPDGDPLTYSASSANVAAASVSVSGSVVSVAGVAEGASDVSVAATDPGGLSAQASFQVTVQANTGTTDPVAISGVSPATLIEGRTATIAGTGFSTTLGANRVTLGGRSARVTAATATSLAFEAPGGDCLPARREELRVTTGGGSDARTVGVAPLTSAELARLRLSSGEYRWTRAGSGCLHLPGGGVGEEYLIGVVSTSESASSLTGVTLTGAPGDATVAAAVAEAGTSTARWTDAEGVGSFAQGPVQAFSQRPLRSARAPVGGAPGAFGPAVADAWTEARARGHSDVMERNWELVRKLGPPSREPAAFRNVRRAPQVGDTLSLYGSSIRSCSSGRRVQAVVRLISANIVWLDDVANPAGTFTDGELADLDAFYASHAKGVHDDYYGGLSDVDGNGRFLVLMTREANLDKIVGWVWSGDLYSRSLCATSNEAEIFYGAVPDPGGVAGSAVTKRRMLDFWYPILLAHEMVHTIQFYTAPDGGATWTQWLREGGATLAEQLTGHRFFGHASGRELGASAISPRKAKDFLYWEFFQGLSWFFGANSSGRVANAPEECSWLGDSHAGNAGPCVETNLAIYYVPALVHRYALDRWGGGGPSGEQALMRSLTRSRRHGFQALASASPGGSWSTERILADFYVSLWTDLQAGGNSPGMTKWNLHEVFETTPSGWGLRTHASSSPSPRLAGRRVRGGSVLYLRWTPTGTLAPTSVKVESAGGGRLPGHISLWALRTR